MHASPYELHVFGLNLSHLAPRARAELSLSQFEVMRVLESFAYAHTDIEALIVRARNHTEAYLAAPFGIDVVRPWVAQLRHFRPDLLHQRRRPLHYHLVGERAHLHLSRITAGCYARSSSGATVQEGLKESLAIAAGCGTLGERLDRLFLDGLGRVGGDGVASSRFEPVIR